MDFYKPRSDCQAWNWNFLWGEVAHMEIDPRALACMEPNPFQEMVEDHFPFSHYPLVRQQINSEVTALQLRLVKQTQSQLRSKFQ